MKPVEIDRELIEQGVRLILQGLGENLAREGIAETPQRVARMYSEIFTDREFSTTRFTNEEQYDDIVMVREIPFYSMCEHHMLPFFGTATLAYIPQASYLGLSKLARIVEYYSRQLQVQERLTMQIAKWLWHQADPAGVGVILKARHLCMEMRGIRKMGNETVTTILLGDLKTDPRLEERFFRMANDRS